VIPVELAKGMAHRLNAETVEVSSCHAVVVAHPEEVSALILKASQADKVSHLPAGFLRWLSPPTDISP
jgi:hypothetical protein